MDHLPPHDHPVLSTYGYGRGVNEDPDVVEPENAYFAVNDRGYSPTPDAVAVAGVTSTVSVSPDGEPVPIMQPSAAVTIAIRARPWDPPPSFFTPAVIVGALLRCGGVWGVSLVVGSLLASKVWWVWCWDLVGINRRLFPSDAIPVTAHSDRRGGDGDGGGGRGGVLHFLAVLPDAKAEGGCNAGGFRR